MSQDNFWDNRNYAQKLVDESSAIKRRIEPLLKAESQQSDMETMLEMAAAEDEATGGTYARRLKTCPALPRDWRNWNWS